MNLRTCNKLDWLNSEPPGATLLLSAPATSPTAHIVLSSPHIIPPLTGDGRFITLTCLDAAVGSPSPSATPSFAPPARRVVARIDASGAIDTSTTLAWTPYTTLGAYGVFAAASADGTGVWVGAGEQYSNFPMYFVPFGSSNGSNSATVAAPSLYYGGATRVYQGQLYTVCASRGVCQVGTGLPLGSNVPNAAHSSIAALPGMANAFVSSYPSVRILLCIRVGAPVCGCELYCYLRGSSGLLLEWLATTLRFLAAVE